MGQRSRPKKKRGLASPAPPPSRETAFPLAMLAVALEDLIGKPCVVCGTPGRYVGVFIPTKEFLAKAFPHRHGRGVAVPYSLCIAIHVTWSSSSM
jgi:hypothetical protein